MTKDNFKALCIQHGQFSYDLRLGYAVDCSTSTTCRDCIFYQENNGGCIPNLFSTKQENEIISSLQADYPELFI